MIPKPYAKLVAGEWLKAIGILVVIYTLGFLFTLAVTTTLLQQRSAKQLASHIITTLKPTLQVNDHLSTRQFIKLLVNRDGVLGIGITLPDGQVIKAADSDLDPAVLDQFPFYASSLPLDVLDATWIYNTSVELFPGQYLTLVILQRNEYIGFVLTAGVGMTLAFGVVGLLVIGVRSRRAIPRVTGPVQSLASTITEEYHGAAAPPEVLAVQETSDAFAKFARNAEELQRQIALKGRFEGMTQIAQMAIHDLRRPFAALRMAIQQSQRAKDPEESAQIMQMVATEIEDAITSSEDMFADILELGVRKQLKTVPVSLAKLVKDSLASLTMKRPRAERVEVAIETGLSIAAQAAKARRVLLNLIENAMDATAESERLWVRAESKGGVAKVEVGNTGSYIPPEDLAKLFEVFFTKGKAGGSGLGLAICKKIVEEHGGTIRCESDRETGTRFVIHWPLAQASEGAAEEIPDVSGGLPRLRVAVVDDNLFMRSMIAKSLEAFEVSLFESPASFFARHEDAKPDYDVVIADYYFPDARGDEFARQLRTSFDGVILICSQSDGNPDPEVFDGALDKTNVNPEDVYRWLQKRQT